MTCPICGEPLIENYTGADIEAAVADVDLPRLAFIVDSPPYTCNVDARSFWPSEIDGVPYDPEGDAKAHVAAIREMLGENSPQLPRRMIELG